MRKELFAALVGVEVVYSTLALPFAGILLWLIWIIVGLFVLIDRGIAEVKLLVKLVLAVVVSRRKEELTLQRHRR